MALGAIKRKKTRSAREKHERAYERERGTKRFHITVDVYRGDKQKFDALACPARKVLSKIVDPEQRMTIRERRLARGHGCRLGNGKTPTAAVKKALHRLASRLK